MFITGTPVSSLAALIKKNKFNFYMYITKILKKFFHFYKIIKHNQKKFVKKSINSDNQILIEFNNFCSSHIALSYCANILKKIQCKYYWIYGHVLLSFP